MRRKIKNLLVMFGAYNLGSRIPTMYTPTSDGFPSSRAMHRHNLDVPPTLRTRPGVDLPVHIMKWLFLVPIQRCKEN